MSKQHGLDPLLNGLEHANPIILSSSKGETRATQYSKGATRGNWNELWESFDRRAKAKASNDIFAIVDDKGEDMIARAGVAAE